MPTRKKAVKAKKDAPQEEAQVVTHVVEIVDETTGETKPAMSQAMEDETVNKEEVKEMVEELKDEVVDVEKKIEEIEEKVESSSVEAPPEMPKEKEKVLEEIFGNQQTAVMPEISGSSKGGGKSLFLWAFIVIAVALLTGLGLLVAVRGPSSVTSMFVTPTPTPTSTPVPTPTPVAVNRADITIEVLNGSGVGGAAAKMREFLEGKGYEVGRAANADSSDYSETEIHVKSEKQEYLSLLEGDLAEGYTVGTASADLPDDSDYDAQVIVGQE